MAIPRRHVNAREPACGDEIDIDRVQAEIRAEARVDREAFSREILRLTSEQSRLAGIVEGPRAE